MTTSRLFSRCLCGCVRIELELPTKFVTHCHCHNCRRAHGAAFVTWAGFRSAQVRVVAGEENVVRYDTDVGSQRTFCGSCGSTLLFTGERWPGEIHVAVGNIEGELDSAPTGHAYSDRVVDWCPIRDDLPRYGGENGTTPLEP